MFTSKVESYRSLVKNTIADVLAADPHKISLISVAGLTNAALTDIILGIIQNESSGDPHAIGDNGDSVGLMQLNFAAGTPQNVGFDGFREELFQPYVNIFYGTKYFLKQLARYMDVEKAVLAYNAGSYRVNQAGVPINLAYLNKLIDALGVDRNYFTQLLEKKNLNLSSPESLPLSDSISSTKEPGSVKKNTLLLGTLASLITIIALLIQNC